MSSVAKVRTVKKFETYLFETFGYKTFRNGQREVIEGVIKRKQDTLCILPTSAGKSVCFQIVPIILERPIIVISPLLSLMEDQSIQLKALGINVCCYSSSLSNQLQTRTAILNGEYQIIYITPETIVNCKDLLQQLHLSRHLALIAIDEAHCVSLWGNSFRSSYLQLGCLKQWLPNVPIMALTATATPKVELDMIKLLKLKNPLIVRSNANRPNLSYFVHTKTDILSDLKSHIGTESCIIYCKKRKQTELIAEKLQKIGLKCEAYHAGLAPEVRKEIHNDFLNDKIHCIIATISFGMGINKATIRKVIHYGCPKDIESYYQETGRAGRDGQLSQCHVYFANSDFATNRYFLKDINDSSIRQHQEQMIHEIEKYLYSKDCRRKSLVEYFGDTLEKNLDNEYICCDNCSNVNNLISIDVGYETKCFLELTQCFSGKFGKLMFINAIKGSNLKNMPVYFQSHEHYGVGRNHNLEWWKTCVQHLINQELINEKSLQNRSGSTIQITQKGLDWLNINQSNPIFIIEENNATSGILSDQGTKSLSKNIKNPPSKKIKDDTQSLTETENETYNLFQNDNLDISEIAKIRQLGISTIEGHLVKCLEKQVELDLNRLNISETIYNEIISIISDELKGDISKLSPIKALCRPEITYAQIKYTIAISTNQFSFPIIDKNQTITSENINANCNNLIDSEKTLENDIEQMILKKISLEDLESTLPKKIPIIKKTNP